MILEIILHIAAFILGCFLARLSIIFLSIQYNEYRVHSKFKKLYKEAKDERVKRDLLIDYSKMDKSIPVNIWRLALHLEKNISCDDFLSKEMSYFLYEY